jgi:hypothetical protein
MAVPRKLVIVPNAATRELWRIAESGGVDELDGVLSQADINARNEHGMTALMRAAYHGRVEMVRVLLELGADPNVTRNDNFTALSLAAFFGHAEIVELLMRHGASTDVATRFGTSPYIWAKARSFGDVARCLEKRRHESKESVIEKSVSPVECESRPEPIVRTLKDPPEIWDLVHEAPRNFDATSTFMARIGSMKGGFLVPVMALLVVIACGVIGAIYLKDRISLPTAPAAAAAPQPATVSTPVVTEQTKDNHVTSESPAIAVEEPASVELNRTIPRTARSFARSRAIPGTLNNEGDNTVRQAAPAPPAIAPPRVDLRAADADTKKTAVPLTPQMISPPKPSQAKGKVIQWP